jgi:hypothetical protein
VRKSRRIAQRDNEVDNSLAGDGSERTPICVRTAACAPQDGFLPHEALMQSLWRQRAMADRTGSRFVFVRMGLAGNGRTEAAVARDMAALARSAGARCRSSDIRGWCDEGRTTLGVLLPDATPQGALCVVRAVEACFQELSSRCTGAGESAPEIACELFDYP